MDGDMFARDDDQVSKILHRRSELAEAGGGAASADPFTLTDGSQTLGLGVRYTRDNMTISGGYSYTKVGDVTITYPMTNPHPSQTVTYADNKVTGIGFKIGFSF